MNTVDIIVIAVVAISALIAFLRGFVREVLTVGSWIGAALVTLYGYGMLAPQFEEWIPKSKLFADIAASFVLFTASLIVLSLISHTIAKFVRGSALTAVDRSLGLLFGLVRGAILVSLAYMIVHGLAPELLSGARTEPMMARGADFLRSLAPKGVADSVSAMLPPQPAPIGNDKPEAVRPPAYSERQNGALQRLIDATTTK